MPLPMDISENDAGFQIDVSVPGTAAADVTVDLDTSTRVLSICTHKERPVGWVDDKITSEPGHHFHRRCVQTTGLPSRRARPLCCVAKRPPVPPFLAPTLPRFRLLGAGSA